MRVDDFDFDLPPAAIAQRPVQPRDAARLLDVGEAVVDRVVRDLPALLRPGDCLVVNNTRVIPARLPGRRGSVILEITLLEETGPGMWRCLVRRARRLRVGQRVDIAPGFNAEVAHKNDDGTVVLAFDQSGDALMDAIERHGTAPLPPYIRRPGLPDARDRRDYQTLFADRPGAVAAPTAGLHFTEPLLAALDDRGIQRVTVTLHVGAGTFLPVKTAAVADHVIHREWGEITADAAEAINAAHAAGGRVVAVGTTSLRLLETAVGADGRLTPFRGDTDLFIVPGFRFRIADMLLTNFHLPRSTLFMLVCAFAGTARMKAAYAHAIAAGYRFYSYGDCCLLERGIATEPGVA
ncbi:MAG: tRNA preQ1(34) S-adenosylmethionine ribosyltransferase-isomerase QueA [Rhodospirillales bacterium]|nr:MAG: tRNA preQ1(34) S-adenosylmethionine ribosyltransferase-isomerase QueA [Rhodospirillales bacterium]